MLLFLAADPHHGLGLKKFLQEESGWKIAYPYPFNQSPPQEAGFLPIPLPPEEEWNTLSLLRHPLLQDFLRKQKRVTLVVFKTSYEIENYLKAFPHVKLAGSPALLTQRIENKIHGMTFLRGLPTPPSLFLCPEELDIAVKKWGYPLVVQVPRGHGGNGTFFIESAKSFKKYALPRKPLKVAPYWPGETYTLNTCVSEEELWISFPLKQITGMAGLTPYRLGSCGNEWNPLVNSTLIEYQHTFHQFAYTVGKRLQTLGFKGLFGLDILIPYGQKSAYILEINPRLTSNLAFSGFLGCSLILKHLQAFGWEPLHPIREEKKLLEGAQLIFRQLGQEKVLPQLPSGVYQLSSKGFEFCRSAWDLNPLAPQEYLILFRRQQELWRIQKNRSLDQWATLQEIFWATQSFLSQGSPVSRCATVQAPSL
jgi:hypothetical protein